MAAKLVIAPEAEQDLAESFGWYEKQRSGLGDEFLSCVDACIERIRRSPEMYAIETKSYRRALVRRFPFLVFYEYLENTVTVYGIFHTARDPEKWRERLK